MKFNNAFDRIEKILMAVSIFALVALVLVIVYDVVVRKITGSSIQGLQEVIQDFLMIAIAYLGTGYTFSRNGHVRMTLLMDHLPEHIASIINRITDFVALATFVVIDIVTIGVVSYNLRNHILSPSVLGYEMWPCYLILLIGLLALTVRLVQSLIFPKTIKVLHDSDEEIAEHM